MIARSIALLLLIMAVTFAQAAPASSPPLEGIPRTIDTEPRYATDSQLHVLMVIGPQAERRVWLVVDGDVLYVDRNGNGDLTEAGEKVQGKSRRNEGNGLVSETRSFSVEGLAPQSEGDADRLQIDLAFFNPKAPALQDPKDDDELRSAELLRHVRATPGAHQCTIWFGDEPALTQHVQVAMSANPAEAPIVHFHGPVSLGLVEGLCPASLRRGAIPAKITVALGTPGVGRGSFVRHPNTKIRNQLHPVGIFEFPPSKPDGKPLRKKVFFKGKC